MQVTSVGLFLFNYQDDARSNKHNDVICILSSMIKQNFQGSSAWSPNWTMVKIPIFGSVFEFLHITS